MSTLLLLTDSRGLGNTNQDTVGPTPPPSLAASNIGTTTGLASWGQSTDPSGVAHYNVYDYTQVDQGGGGTGRVLLGTVDVQPGTGTTTHFGTLVTQTAHAATEKAGGTDTAMLELNWASYETADGVFSGSYIASIQSQLATLQAAGLNITLAMGVHHPPAWALAMSNSKQIDQTGAVTGQIDTIFNKQIRAKVEAYYARIHADLNINSFSSIRLTSGGNAEMLHPGGNSYWAFGPNAQNGADMPTTMAANPFPGWKPGGADRTITTAQVRTWATWYVNALCDVTNWQMAYFIGLGYTGTFQTLTPGSGRRPSVFTTDVNNYLPNSTTGVGAVWDIYYADLPSRLNVVVYISSVADGSGSDDFTQTGDNALPLTSTTMNAWSATRWQTRIAHEYSLPVGGENPGYTTSGAAHYSDTTAAGLMAKAMAQVRNCGLTYFYWAHDDRLWDGTQTFANYAAAIAQINGPASPVLGYVGGAKGNDGLTTLGSLTCPIVVPATAAVDQIALVTLESNSGKNVISGAPLGWSLLSGPDTSSVLNIRTWLYAKQLEAGDPGSTVTWTLSGGARFTGIMDVISGADMPGTPTFLNQTGSNTALTDATITTVKANSWVYEVYIARSASGTPCVITLPTSPAYTARTTCTTNNGTTNHTIKSGTFTTTTAGAKGGNTGSSAPAAAPINYYALEIPVTTPTASTLSFNLTTLQPGVDNIIGVTAVDASPNANEGDPSFVTVTTGGVADTTAPTVPVPNAATSITQTTAVVTWPSSTDDQSGVDHYIVKNGATVLSSTVTGTSYTLTGLTASTAYAAITVAAVDGSGNISDDSAPVPSFTTLATADTTNPLQVTGLGSQNVLATQTGLGWDQGSDNSGTIDHYNIYWDNGTGGTANILKKSTTGDVLSTTITGLTASTPYKFAVSAVDPSGNEGTKSGTITVTTTAAGTGIFYGINAVPNFSLYPNDGLPLGQRDASRGWKTAAGVSWVDSNGNATGVGITRQYYGTGGLPSTFNASKTTGGNGTNVNKRCNFTYKGGGTFKQVAQGSLDVAYRTFVNALPINWDALMTYFHEPANNFDTGDNSPAWYKEAQKRLCALTVGNTMPTGQAVIHTGTPNLALQSGVKVRTAVCVTIPRPPAGNNSNWDQVQLAVPKCSEVLDPNYMILLDAYGNPPPPDTQTIDAGHPTLQSLYPTPAMIWSYYFDNVHSQWGFDTGTHGYGVGEFMFPPRTGDNANGDGQAAAFNAYLNYLETTAPNQPVAVIMWENPHDVEEKVGSHEQHALPATRQAMVNHAFGKYAQV